jgi:hypothetical protein
MRSTAGQSEALKGFDADTKNAEQLTSDQERV